MTGWGWNWRCDEKGFLVKTIYETMKSVEDPRSPRKKKHELAVVLTCLVAGYVTGHTSLRRCMGWCRRHENWLKKMGLPMPEGIASVSTVSRLLSTIDEALFLFSFIEWIGGIVRTKGVHLAVDGKAIRAAAEKCKGKRAPMMLHVLEAATGLVVAQLPIPDKESEITSIPELLSYLDIRESTITADALNTQTSVMERIIAQGGHFVMMIKRNQANSYEEILSQFGAIKAEQERLKENPVYQTMNPEYLRKYDEVSYSEKNRDRYEYREYRVINDASFVSKTERQWPFLKSVGYVEQTRILIVRDEEGNDITPSKERFVLEGSSRQPPPGKGEQEKEDVQVVGIISDKRLTAAEMARCKRDHWSVENRLHHVLDDTFREDRSPARGSRNNLALIRKFALNILRLVQIQTGNRSPISEMMDLLNDDKELLERYVFKPIESLY